ncbi:MAG: type II 3-dehydroquinate dehydratase [Flavobacteriales bacterium]|nr:type II 3-dehydroquinate dehydratase [Flavobacteriales bacterium]
MRIAIINGPNLNLLGKREPDIYGEEGFRSFLERLHAQFPQVEFSYFQSNVEGELIDELHRVGFTVDGIVLNAGGYTHTSVAIGDAVAAIESPVIEVHISNVHAREEYRHQSLMAKHCHGVITGFGLTSYTLAVQALTTEEAS